MQRNPWVVPVAFVLAGAVAAAGALAGPARASDTTAEQADALRRELHDFAAGLIGPQLTVPDDLVAATPEGDHFRLAFTTPRLPGLFDVPITVSVAVRELDDGTWTIEDARYPNPILLDMPTLRLPKPDGAPGAGRPRADTPEAGKIGVAINAGSRELHGLFDPSLTRSSTLQSDVGGIDMEITGPDMRQQAQIGQQTSALTMTPAADGSVDLREAISARDVRVAQTAGASPSLAYESKSFRVTLDIDHLALGRLPLLLRTGLQLGAARDGKAATDGLDDAERALLTSGLTALRDLMTGIRLGEQLDGVHLVSAQGLRLDLDRMEFGLDAAAPAAAGSVRATLLFDGLRVPDAPAAIAAYLPTHVELRPIITGIDLRGLTNLALAAVAAGADPSALSTDAMALLRAGNLDVGLERVALDVGPARLAGHGTMRVRGPDDIAGEAEITATGFDAFAEQLRRRPDARQALPFLTMARKLAKADGDRLTWRITVDRNLNAQINGTDLSRLKGKPL